jgi:osmotically-inducible protein OsmY
MMIPMVSGAGFTKGNLMTTGSLTQTDLRIRDTVLQQLAWDSQVDASGIGVTAKNGVVTMTGYIDSYAGKLGAERAAKRVRGVRAVANDIQVRLRFERIDADLAADAARALDLRATLPAGVQAVVHSGHLKLTGTVPLLFQRAVAENAVRHIKGIKGIVNRIEVALTASVPDIRRQIARALHRDTDVNGRGIEVAVSGTTVTLTGNVESWHERESAERAAMHAAGITHVDNRILVVWPEPMDDDLDDEIC